MNEITVHVIFLEHKNYKGDVLLEISSVKWDLNIDVIWRPKTIGIHFVDR